jgi:hypothetical protein
MDHFPKRRNLDLYLNISKYYSRLDRKVILSFGIGIGMMFLVYFALTGSLDRPVINRVPIPPEAAVSIVITHKSSMHLNPNDFAVGYVYIKGNGDFYESNENSNSVGLYLGTASSTISGGNYFAWKVENKVDGSKYFIEPIDGDIISQSK